MQTFRQHLNEHLKDPEFQQLYHEESLFVNLAFKVNRARTSKNLSKSALAAMAQVSVADIEKIEAGERA